MAIEVFYRLKQMGFEVGKDIALLDLITLKK